MYNNERTVENKRDNKLEDILGLLNETLKDDEMDLISRFNKPQYPTIFIVGNARSGTTLLYQWLASTGLFAYPSNIISRFYNAPYIGALIHQMFVEHDKFGELLGDYEFNFKSNLGKTKSPIAPHEFWYFWRRFFDFGEIQQLPKEELAEIDTHIFIRELAALEGAFKKPLILKGMILNWNLEFLKNILPNAIFIHLKRDGIYNMQSLYRARLTYFGDIEKWYSFKPPEYKMLKLKSVYEQLAGQVSFTNQAIGHQFDKMENKDCLMINYEDLCSKPKQIFGDLMDLLKNKNIRFDYSYNGPKEFKNSNKKKVEEFDFNKARKAIGRIS